LRWIRWIALVGGVGLVIVAVGAVTRVADTREGLIAEVVTLFAALAGISLLIYGLAARPRPAGRRPAADVAIASPPRTRRDLVTGGAGIALGAVLFTGLAISGGPLLAVLGLAVLLPMVAGSVYLCVRYLRTRP
jgi:hypothetical protein